MDLLLLCSLDNKKCKRPQDFVRPCQYCFQTCLCWQHLTVCELVNALLAIAIIIGVVKSLPPAWQQCLAYKSIKSLKLYFHIPINTCTENKIVITYFLLLSFRLPLPWLLYTMVNSTFVNVSSKGAACSIGMLFLMLILVFLSILSFKWKMTKVMGCVMLVLYVVFVIISLGFSYGWYKCPV